MRKLILAGILVLIIIFSFFAMKVGITFPTKIYSFSELKARKELTNTQLDSLTTLKSTTYTTTQNMLNDSIKKFKSAKELYEAAMSNKTEIEKQRAIAGVSYDLSYLWVKLGKYATENKCDLTIEVFQNQETSAEENYTLCDFKFNVSGTYLALIDFIEAISIDQELSFIPENLKMYSEYADVMVDEDHFGPYNKKEQKGENTGITDTTKATILMLKTEFYKTNVPIYKTSLSKVENQLTVEQDKAAAEEALKNGNTTNSTTNNATNNTVNNTTNNTTNATNTTNTTN